MNDKNQKCLMKTDNRGFSLMELLVSIVILILIMIPLMGNFFRSARMNNEAQETLNYSNLASDLMEETKKVISATPVSEDKIATAQDGTEYDVRISVDAEKYEYKSKTGHGDILFNDYAMPDITSIDANVNGLFFSNIYKNTTDNSFLTDEELLSEIKAHSLIEDKDLPNLQQSQIAAVLPANIKSMDQLALDYFTSAGEDYADSQFKASSAVYADYLHMLQEIQNGKSITPAPVEPPRSVDSIYADPDYCKPDLVSTWITKTINISVSKTEPQVGKYVWVINYQLAYKCVWPADVNIINNEVSYKIVVKQYATQINNVYLFYKKSLFQEKDPSHPDVINITNNSDDPTNDIINFYLVKQGDTETPPPSVIINSDNVDSESHQLLGILLYSNMSDNITAGNFVLPTMENSIIVTSAPQDRIYSVKVEIYTLRDGETEAKYQDKDKLYELESMVYR